MKKIIIGVFAHPDDEAFGVSPTLIKEIREGAEAHLITLTAGEEGANPDNHAELGTVRLHEWQRSCELMRITRCHHLGYTDGTLSNSDLLTIADRVGQLTENILATTDSPIEFMSFDMNGISGHIDHIVASRATALVFYRLKQLFPERITRLRLRCLPIEQVPQHTIDWLYMDAGRTSDEITEVVDAREYHDTIIEVIRSHHSQRADGETHIARYGNDIGINHFIVKQ